jgi:hypothetical protein
MADPYSDMIAAIISSKGGSDFSSNTMDPVMQYLLGNYQSTPQFTEDDLYNREAPTFQWAGAEPFDSSWFQAAKAIRQGVNPFNIKRDKKMREASGISPDEWSSFVDSLMKENQSVKAKMLDQGLQQDVFQKAGMRGAQASYTDMNPDGSQTYAQDAYQFAPTQFDELRSNLPAQLISDAARRRSVDAKYGGNVFATSEKDKLAALIADAGQQPLKVIQQQQLDAFRLQPEVQADMIKRMRRDSAMHALDRAGSNPIVDKRATAIGRSDANAINAYMDRKQGSGANTQRQVAELAAQVLASLAQQGATPLKTDIMRNAMLKKSTKNGN